MSNSGQRQRKTPQPPMSPPPPTVSPLSNQRDDDDEDEPSLWPNQRRRSVGPLNPPQLHLPSDDRQTIGSQMGAQRIELFNALNSKFCAILAS